MTIQPDSEETTIPSILEPELQYSKGDVLKQLWADYWDIGIGVAVASYFVADLIGFFPIVERGLIGISAVLLFMALQDSFTAKLKNFQYIARLAVLIVVVMTLSRWTHIENIVNEAKQADILCASIEQEMLKAKPHRADLPNLFEALRCHASGKYSINFPTVAKPSNATTVRTVPQPRSRLASTMQDRRMAGYGNDRPVQP